MKKFFLLTILICSALLTLVSCNPEPEEKMQDPNIEIVYYEDGVTEKSRTEHKSDGSVDYCEFDRSGTRIKWIVYRPDGSKSRVSENDSHGYTTLNIVYLDDGTYSYYKGTHEYDAEGKRIRETVEREDGTVERITDFDANGNTIKITSYIADGSVQIYEYVYDENGKRLPYKVTFLMDDGSNTYVASTIDYDSEGNQSKVIQYNSDGTIYHVTEYDANGVDITKYYNDYLPDGTKLLYEYDLAGKLVKKTVIHPNDGYFHNETDVYEYDSQEKLIRWVRYKDDFVNYIETYVYDSEGNKISSESIRTGGLKYVYEYDSHSNVIKETVYNADGSFYDCMVFEYDADNNIKNIFSYDVDNVLKSKAERDTDGNTIRITYYNADQTVYSIDENGTHKYYNIYHDDGTKEVFEYESDITKISYYDADGVLDNTLKLNASGNEIERTSFHYNADGTYHYTTTYDSEGRETIRYFNVYNADGTKAIYDYDRNGKLTALTKYNADETVGETYEYDALESVRKHMVYRYHNAETVSAVLEYDADENLTKETYFNEDSTKYYCTEHKSGGSTVTKYYNQYNADGTKVITEYDEAENPIRKTAYNADNTVWYVATYDANGNETRKKYNVYNADGSKNLYEYDADGRIVHETYYNAKGLLFSDTTNTYDNDGNLIRIYIEYPTEKKNYEQLLYYVDGYLCKYTSRFPDGSTVIYEVNRSGQNTKLIEVEKNGTITRWEERTYDSHDRLIILSYRDGQGAIICWNEWEYQPNGNCSKYTEHYDDGSVFVYEYSETGQRKADVFYNADASIAYRIDYTTNTKSTYSYNTDGTISFIEESNLNNVLLRKIIYKSNVIYCVSDYDSNGNKTKATYYDKGGRETEIDEYNTSGTLVKFTEIEYSPDGSRLVIETNELNDTSKATYYNADSTVDHYVLYELDYFGRSRLAIKATVYSAENELMYWYSFGRTSTGIKTSITYYSSLGTKLYTEEYDLDDNVITRSEYDENGKLVKETHYNVDGSIASTVDY